MTDIMHSPDVVTASIRIAATPAEVFPYLTNTTLIVQWIGNSAELNPTLGGVFALDFDNTSVRGTFVAIEPPDRVVFTWGIPGSTTLPAGSSTVEIVLIEDGAETIVELRHFGLPADERPKHLEGWTQCLGVLATATFPPSS